MEIKAIPIENFNQEDTQEHLSDLLKSVSGKLSQALEKKFSNEGIQDITESEWLVLREISAPQVTTAGQICQRLQLGKSAVSKLLGQLEKKQLLTRHDLQFEGHGYHINLTRKGKDLLAQRETILALHEKEYLSNLLPEENKLLFSFLTRLLATNENQSLKFGQTKTTQTQT